MTPERAQEIWDTRASFGEFSLSPEEKAYVNGIKVRLPGHFNWADVLLEIANGKTMGLKPMIGTAVYYYGDEIIDQSPVYLGETVDSYSVSARARQSIELLGHPATDPVHGCNARLHKLGRAQVKFYPLGH